MKDLYCAGRACGDGVLHEDHAGQDDLTQLPDEALGPDERKVISVVKSKH